MAIAATVTRRQGSSPNSCSTAYAVFRPTGGRVGKGAGSMARLILTPCHNPITQIQTKYFLWQPRAPPPPRRPRLRVFPLPPASSLLLPPLPSPETCPSRCPSLAPEASSDARKGRGRTEKRGAHVRSFDGSFRSRSF
ncbi:hypothetical protein GSI_10446 [Ganoderma sinense ZZ0214-1]|uniref:Uncharacterized protein n=1 Tax=Ganoderma sinense ZZ0214-1 TaxID=1077348 RepID=A0A2G8S0K3_9APHY|nr:hypothetical protein GSI_10446 [Ganoderma sinense ZZ0214-1]